jgi:hypothetical protein
VGELRDALGDWLERLRAGAVDPARVRAAVADHTEERWLDQIEAEVRALA